MILLTLNLPVIDGNCLSLLSTPLALFRLSSASKRGRRQGEKEADQG